MIAKAMWQWYTIHIGEEKKRAKMIKMLSNCYFQNVLKITCKNESRKPLFMRVLRRQGRNEESPLQGIDTLKQYTHHLLNQ